MTKTRQRTLVTGGAGFIGSALVRHLVSSDCHEVLNVDALTYASNLSSLVSVADRANYTFAKIDICDINTLDRAVQEFRPTSIIHMAAESHVDRSIDGPDKFVMTNVVGSANVLQSGLTYWRSLAKADQANFRIIHVSTDEVYGTLGPHGAFNEDSPFAPNSPYAASKASSDLLARAWHKTYGLPVMISNCSNNYGPFQFPEKLIPVVIIAALDGKPIPVYGAGENVRDWVYVDDHVKALQAILDNGTLGETYNIGGATEIRNLDLVKAICAVLDTCLPGSSYSPHEHLISMVSDRPGHDFRYAVDHSKITAQLGWKPTTRFEDGIYRTVKWYLNNKDWWEPILKTKYDGHRQGLGKARY